MYDFNYQRAASVADASARLKASDDAMLMAGGMTLIPTLKQRLAQPVDVVDLGGVCDLAGISVDGDMVTIGAMTTHATVAACQNVRSKIPALADLANGIGDPQVRNRGTIGGSIANNDPAADYPSACLGLDAIIVTDQREITADDFFVGMFETALEESEVVIAVKFPKPFKAAYMKFPNPASRYAIVGVYVAKFKKETRVAITGAGNKGVFRSKELNATIKRINGTTPIFGGGGKWNEVARRCLGRSRRVEVTRFAD